MHFDRMQHLSEAKIAALYHSSYRVTNMFYVTGLAIDYFNQRLYWADTELSVIGSVRFDGSDSVVVVSSTHGEQSTEDTRVLNPLHSLKMCLCG